MRARTGLAVAGAVTLVAMLWIWSGRDPNSEQPSEQHLQDVAKQLNRLLPLMLDKNTEWTSTSALAGTLVYHYSVTDPKKLGVDPADEPALNALLRATLADSACGARETREGLLDRDVTMRYRYLDRKGQPIASIDITAEDCPAK